MREVRCVAPRRRVRGVRLPHAEPARAGAAQQHELVAMRTTGALLSLLRRRAITPGRTCRRARRASPRRRTAARPGAARSPGTCRWRARTRTARCRAASSAVRRRVAGRGPVIETEERAHPHESTRPWMAPCGALSCVTRAPRGSPGCRAPGCRCRRPPQSPRAARPPAHTTLGATPHHYRTPEQQHVGPCCARACASPCAPSASPGAPGPAPQPPPRRRRRTCPRLCLRCSMMCRASTAPYQGEKSSAGVSHAACGAPKRVRASHGTRVRCREGPSLPTDPSLATLAAPRAD